MDVSARRRIEGSDRPLKLDRLGDDVVSYPTFDASHSHDRGGERRIQLTRDNCLQSEHHLAGSNDWVNSGPRHRTVCLLTLDGDLVAIRGGHETARTGGNGAGREGEDVQAEDHVRARIFKGAFHQHQFCATHGAIGCSFLCRLENKLNGSGQLISHARKHFGDAHQDGDVVVVTAGVHNADLTSLIDALCF